MKLHSLPYSTYKNSNSEWVEEIPDEWTEKRVKDIFCLVTDLAPKNNNYELLSLYTSIGVKPRKDMDEQRGNKSVTTDDYWMVKKGDIIINKLLAWMGAVGLSDYDGVTSPAYDILRKKRQNKPEVDARFYTYLFRTEKAQQIFKRHSRGIMDVRLRLYFDKLGAITVPVPPISAQKIIADYIDTRTAHLDRKIDLLNKKAQKYTELKQALISETVLRGLDKTVPVKDSGVEWIGEIPAHWEIKRVKEIGLIVLGKMLDNTAGDGKFYQSYLKSKNIGWLKVDDTEIEKMYFSLAEMKSYRLKKDDILLSEGGEVGKTSFWNNEIEECYIQNSVHKITVHKNNHPRYFLYQSFLLGSIKYYDSIVNQVSIKHLTKEKLSRVIMVRPPLSEQKAISKYLESKIADIDLIINTIKAEIEKLKYLRKTLINDVVTGKIKVYEA